MDDIRPALVAADLEGVFFPEIWIAVAHATGIEDLRVTTRDVADYDELMRYRLDILRRHGLRLPHIQKIIGSMDPLPGATAFADWIRARTRLVILTDSFYEFVDPFLAKLHHPTVFAHRLVAADDGSLVGYRLRLPDSKRRAVEAFRLLGFRTLSFGDSYNDTSMLAASDVGVLFQPPSTVRGEFPEFAVAEDYAALQAMIREFLQTQASVTI